MDNTKFAQEFAKEQAAELAAPYNEVMREQYMISDNIKGFEYAPFDKDILAAVKTLQSAQMLQWIPSDSGTDDLLATVHFRLIGNDKCVELQVQEDVDANFVSGSVSGFVTLAVGDEDFTKLYNRFQDEEETQATATGD